MGVSEISDLERADQATELRELCLYLKTVGDTLRLLILKQLAHEGEMSVTDLAQALRVSQPLLSWHLGVLRRISLVQIRRDGRLAWYSLDWDVLEGYRRRFRAWIGDQVL